MGKTATHEVTNARGSEYTAKSSMAQATIGTVGHYNPKEEAIEAYIARLTIWLKANKVENNDKVNAALSVMGPSAFSVLLNTCHPDDPSTKALADLTKILQQHYHAPRNKLLERKAFREWTQKDAESVSDYALELKRLSMTCEFADTLEDNLLERFCSGLKTPAIRNKLYTLTALTWAGAQAEAVSMEQNRDGRSQEQGSINQVNRGKYRRGGSGFARGRQFTPRNSGAPESGICERCLSTEHGSSECPYKHCTCYGCNRKGHMKWACRNIQGGSQSSSSRRGRGSSRGSDRGSKSGRGRGSTGQVNQVEQSDGAEHFESEFDRMNLYQIRAVHDESESEFKVTVLVETTDVTFAVDTQAAVSVISENLYYKNFDYCKLKPVKYALRSYSGHEIPVLGQINVNVEYQGQRETVPLVVVKGVKEALLGRDWLKVIKLDWKMLFQTTAVKSVEEVVRKYNEVFEGKIEHSIIKQFEANVRLKPEAQAVFRKARPVPYALRSAVEENLQKAIDEGIMKPVKTSKWASPIVVAPKADGKICVCGDNKKTVNLNLDDEIYPLPTAQDIFATLAGGQIFSTIDLSNAYQQVRLTEASKELLTINTHKGLFQYDRLPYGIKVAPAIFQSIMDQILSGLSGVCCYLDDILLTSKTIAQHVELLEEVLSRLKDYGVLANRAKCKFGIEKVHYLGHIIDRSGIQPSPEKVQAIQAVSEPTNVSELRTFLGAVTFYHKFMENFASNCAPLYDLTKKDAKWSWTPRCRQAFNKVKEMLASNLLLTHYDVSMPLKLSTDASPYGVAAVLAHVVDGFERPIAYASRTLSPAEKNYSQLEREALAIMFGIKRFHKYVYGRKFTLVTDNKPLSIIFSPTKDIPTVSALRLQRWALVLMAHDYTVEYRKSSDHGNVDMLSRFPDSSGVEETLELPINHFSYVDDLPVTCQDVRTETAADPNLMKVMRYMMFGWPDQVEEALLPYHRRRNELSIEQGCLLWGMRVIIPKPLQAKVLQDVHHEHTGVVRMKMLARSYYWFPGVDQDLENLAKSCEACRMHAKAPAAAPIVSWPKCTVPLERVHIDFGSIDNKDLLIMVDVYSKWVEVAVMPTTTSSRVIDVLRSWWARLGLPSELVSDNGPQFISSEFEDFLRRNGVKHTLSPPYSPKTNGSAERSVQTVKGILKRQLTEEMLRSTIHRTFQQKLDDFLITYRSTPSTVTGQTPAELMLGRKLRTRLSFLRPEGKGNVREVVDKIREFSEGDLVWVKNQVGRIKWSPGEIIRRQGLLKYVVNIDNRQRVVHVDHLSKRVRPEREPEIEFENVPIPMRLPNDELNNVPMRLPNDELHGLPNVPIVGDERNVQEPGPNVVPDVPEVAEPPQVPVVADGPIVVPRRNPGRARKVPERLIENC